MINDPKNPNLDTTQLAWVTTYHVHFVTYHFVPQKIIELPARTISTYQFVPPLPTTSYLPLRIYHFVPLF